MINFFIDATTTVLRPFFMDAQSQNLLHRLLQLQIIFSWKL